MNNWIEFYEPMSFEMLQWELFFREMAEFLPTAIIYGLCILLGIYVLLAALDSMYIEDRNLPQSRDGCKTGELSYEASSNRLSQVAGRLSESKTSAAA